MAKAEDVKAAEPAATPAADPPVAEPITAETIAAALEAPVRRGKAQEPRVSYRVLKRGDGQVFTGQTDPETGLPETYAKGDQVDDVALSIAEALEARDFVEIVSA